MERLVINIPENKSDLVKQILKGLGVIILQENQPFQSTYRKKLVNVTTWAEEDLRIFEESKKAFGDLKTEPW